MGHNHRPVATKGRTAAYPVRVRKGGAPLLLSLLLLLPLLPLLKGGAR